jgi:hypothetical protein
MRAFVAEIDPSGIRWLVPEDLIPQGELGRLARGRSSRPTTVVWVLLDDLDVGPVRTEVIAGRYRNACGLVLNYAVEIIPLTAALPEPARPV